MNNKCLILILYCLKILNKPSIFQSLIWRMLSSIKPILNHPLPMTLWQLRGFLGITDYCHIWILGYGELARPLYKLITETQTETQTNKLVWSPETQKALKLFKLLSCRLQLWACPQYQSLICLLLKKKKKLWPHCLRVTATVILLMPKAHKFTSGQTLTVLTSHGVCGILNSKVQSNNAPPLKLL